MLIDRREIIWAMVKSEKGIDAFSEKLGVKRKSIENALHNGSCNNELVEALTRCYGVDYSWLQREDMRGKRNAHKT